MVHVTKIVEHLVWIQGAGFLFPLDRNISCLKNVDSILRLSVGEWKINAAAHAWMTYEML